MFKECPIEGLITIPLKFHEDERGWLTEIFRKDEVSPNIMPVMSYISATKPGKSRGPHEHTHQTDYFTFNGPGKFLFTAWDNRKTSHTYQNKVNIIVGEENKCIIIVPPGIVHGYANIGTDEGVVYNCPNKLFAGNKKREKIDEVRHEDDGNSPFVIDFINQIETLRSS